MSWKSITVTSGKKELPALQRDHEVQLPNKIGKSTTITIDGKSRKVESWNIDERDDVINIILAGARKAEETSDDKPTEGPD